MGGYLLGEGVGGFGLTTKSTTAILKWWCAADAQQKKMELPRAAAWKSINIKHK